MGRRHRELSGFTLIELLITVVIIGIVSVMGINSLMGRVSSAKVEEAAKMLASDLSYARSSANLKGCPIRFIMCVDKNCSNATTQLTAVGSPTFVGSSAAAPAQYYGVLRHLSNDNNLLTSDPCVSTSFNAADGYDHWDFNGPEQARPRSIPEGVVFSPIYASGGIGSSDGTVVSNALVFTGTNWLWFSPSMNPSTGTIPVTTNPLTATGNTIAFQIRMQHCNPATSEDCLGYFVTISPGGVTNAQRCFSGGRANNTDKCF